MKSLFKSSIALSLITPCILLAYETRPSTVTLRHIESGGVGYNYGYTTLHAFLTQNPENRSYVPFIDIRGHVLDDGTWAANGGFGVRKTFKDRIYGINGFYDYRGTNRLNYNQISFGVETLGTLVDARLNTYIPCGKKVTKGYNPSFGFFKNNYMHLSEKKEYAMTGADAEVGFNLGKCSSWRYYAALGPYFFHGDIGPNAWGGKVRFKASYKQYFAIEVIDSYDNVFKNHLQGQIYVSLPFGKKLKEKKSKKIKPSKLPCRYSDPVQRNEIIVLNHGHKHPVAKDPLTGSPYYFVFVNNTSASKGTFESPYHSLLQAQDNSQNYDIIYLYPGDGTTKNMDTGITLKNYQKLWGAGNTQKISTQAGTITVPPQASSQPKITSLSIVPATTLAQNNEISGVTYLSTYNTAIQGVDPETLIINSCKMTDCGTNGGQHLINIDSSIPIEADVSQNQFLSNQDMGVYFKLRDGVTNASITFSDNFAHLNQGKSSPNAIFVIDPSDTVGTCTLFASGNTFDENITRGFLFTSPSHGTLSSLSTKFLSNTIIDGYGGVSFQVNCSSCSITAMNNQIIGNYENGFNVFKDQYKMPELYGYFVGNKLSYGTNFSGGIQISGVKDNVKLIVTDNEMIGNAASGFAYSDVATPFPDVDIVVSNNVILNNQNNGVNAAGGIAVDGFKNLNLVIEDNFLSNSQGAFVGGYGGPYYAPENITVSAKNNDFSLGDQLRIDYWGEQPNSSCLFVEGNNVDAPGSYLYLQRAQGSCYIAPLNYESVNTGTFTFGGTITPVSTCTGFSCDLEVMKKIPVEFEKQSKNR